MPKLQQLGILLFRGGYHWAARVGWPGALPRVSSPFFFLPTAASAVFRYSMFPAYPFVLIV